MKVNTKKKQKTFQKSRNLITGVFNIFTFLPFVAKPADQRKKYFYRIDAHVRRFTQKNCTFILITALENNVSS